mmetsp:Transcript_57042/g.138954  ORF Transcript_57042/g.138954 Transcript_57042/m.138954 type:complete len:214 (+) Transcript_57042:304-945(+)
MSRNLIPQPKYCLVSSIVTAMFALMLLLMFTAVNAQGSGGTMNGRCDDQICVCKVQASTTCPEWISDTSFDGGPYDTTSSSSCGPSDGSSGSSVRCTGWLSDFFTEYPNEESTCTINADGSFVVKYVLWDGNSTTTTSPPLMNYTEQDPMPDCSQDIPFTLVPSSMPTISPAPTPTDQPSSRAPAVYGQGLDHALFSVVSIAGMAATTMFVLH